MFSIFYSASFHTSHISSKPRYIPHILMKTYALIVYKFLDIGIVVGRTSYIEIAIRNNRDNRILPHATWKAFIEKRIERLMQSTVSSSSSPLIQNLNVELVKVCDKRKIVIIWYMLVHETNNCIFILLYLNSSIRTLN